MKNASGKVANAYAAGVEGACRAPRNAGILPAVPRASRPRGFSLIEVLLAVFILGIGMIMVASVFPVGAKWTQETTEESMGQVVAQTAMSVINTHYGPGGDLRSFLAPDFFLSPSGLVNTPPNVPVGSGNLNTILQAPITGPVTPFTLQALPGFLSISPNERAYQFNKSKAYPAISQNAFPVADPTVCTYFWTALARLNPSHISTGVLGSPSNINGIAPTSSYKYDVYILVFHKGLSDQQFTAFSTPQGEVPNTRFAPAFWSQASVMPSVFYSKYSAGNFNSSQTPAIFNTLPQIGEYGIGAYSGTVFRQSVDPGITLLGSGAGGAIPRPMIAYLPTPANPAGTLEPIIYSPPADNTSSSPLVYVYQTTLSF